MHTAMSSMVERMLHPDFVEYLHGVTYSIYESLGRSYKNNSNEVQTVTQMVDTINNQKSFKNIRFLSSKIHGSKSYVSFNYQDKPTTKELGDMIIISILTYNGKRILQKVCIVQNKKAQNSKWDIDKEQLFLLKNFPPLTGKQGIVKGFKKTILRNFSGCLGAYGLFNDPGEMTLISAPRLTNLLSGKKSISENELTTLDGNGLLNHSKLVFLEEYYYYLCRHGIKIDEKQGFFGNSHFSRDVYDFMTNWTHFNIGESVFFDDDDNVVQGDLDDFTNEILLSSGLSKKLDLEFKINNKERELDLDTDLSVFVLHVNIKDKDSDE